MTKTSTAKSRPAKAAPAPIKAPSRRKAAVEAPPLPAGPKGKLGQVVALLRRPQGASIADMQAATGWQAHSVRGVLSGAVKKKLGLTLASEKAGEVRIYRIAQEDRA